MPTPNNTATVTHIDGTWRPIDPSLLDFLREQTRAAIVERREKLGNGTGGVLEREELAVLYPLSLTLGLDPFTLTVSAGALYDGIPENVLHSTVLMIEWGRREAGLDA